MKPDDLMTVLAGLRQTLDELKGRQLVNASSVEVKTTDSGHTYDYTATVAFPSSAAFTVTFTADHQDYAPTDLVPLIYVGSPSTPATLGADYFPGSFYRMKQDPAAPRVTKWRVQVYNLTGTPSTFYLKVRVISTDSGVIS